MEAKGYFEMFSPSEKYVLKEAVLNLEDMGLAKRFLGMIAAWAEGSRSENKTAGGIVWALWFLRQWISLLSRLVTLFWHPTSLAAPPQVSLLGPHV